MFTFRRVTAIATSLFIAVAAAGCSADADVDGQGTTHDELGESTAPLARFTPHMKSLQTTLESGLSNEEIAKALLGSGRPASFSLQSLCRVYADADPKFKEIRDAFKGLEDGIGGYAKWDDIYQSAVSANRDEATLVRLKTERDNALVKFTKLLTDEKWLTTDGAPNRIQTIQAFLDGFDWKTRADDRKVVLTHLIKELKDINETTYDMKILEYGNGVHELRRDIRWVLIEQVALNGMIVSDPAGACPIADYSALPPDGRFGNLRPTPAEPDPCQISQCLLAAAGGTVSSLGQLKDQAEIEVNINGDSDVVPERLQQPANDIYSGIVRTGLVSQYIAQLEACKESL